MFIVLDLGVSYYKVLICDEVESAKSPTILEKHSLPSNTQLEPWLSAVCKEPPTKIIITGGKSKTIPSLNVCSQDIVPICVGELSAIGFASDCNYTISVGTGTAIVRKDGKHMGGSGIGGGTLLGLGKLMTNVESFEELEKIALVGTRKADLSLANAIGSNLANLSENATASNFGRASFKTDKLSDEDIALSCFVMVAETAVVLAKTLDEPVCFTGKLFVSSLFKTCIENAAAELGVKYSIHNDPSFATVLGALNFFLE